MRKSVALPPPNTDPKARAALLAAGLTVIALTTWEGMDLTAKQYRHDPPGVTTYCVGATNIGERHRKVRIGQTFTEEECKRFLLEDFPAYAKDVDRYITAAMPPHRRAAIISFTYNVGGGALKRSSVRRHLNAGRVEEACDALLLYTKANGRHLRGLQNRREWERRWCLRND